MRTQIAAASCFGRLNLNSNRRTISVKVALSNNIKNFIQSGRYEPAILELMNRSVRLFPYKYQHNDNQSHGECDFYAIVGEDQQLIKYDVKLPFDEKQGRLLCSNKANFAEWVKLMLKEAAQFSDCITKGQGIHNVDSLKLYGIIKNLLSRISPDEDLILFLPFPITLDYENGFLRQFATDILSAIFDELSSSELLSNHVIYTIYPSIDGKMVIRNLNNNTREFVDSPEITAYISYDFSAN